MGATTTGAGAQGGAEPTGEVAAMRVRAVGGAGRQGRTWGEGAMVARFDGGGGEMATGRKEEEEEGR